MRNRIFDHTAGPGKAVRSGSICERGLSCLREIGEIPFMYIPLISSFFYSEKPAFLFKPVFSLIIKN
jgi:hypothetical protein